MAELEKNYNPQEAEPRIYKLWEESGYFNPEKMIADGLTKPNAQPFTIMMPPPNVTGVLHMGHAMMLTLEDIMIRYHRMKGDRTLWVPGTDHAAIATQARVEKDIQKAEDKSRYDLGREELVRRIEAFALQSKNTILEQVKTMGASCDWSRLVYTLDEGPSKAVRMVFKQMYDDGLIYRGNRIVNWDPKGQTTIADDEIVYESRKAKLYTFKYSKDFPIEISTTRPETKVGDTAVAVNPKDTRYQQYVGKEYSAVFCGVPLKIKVVADEGVDMAFGTGALGVTPAHSQIDWEIAQKNNLSVKQVISERAKMVNVGGELEGKKTLEARELIVAWLKNEGLLSKEEEIDQNVATAERTGGIVEPLPKLQWFVDVNKEFKPRNQGFLKSLLGGKTTLKKIMREAVESGQVDIMPDHFKKIYFHWIENLRDWCISRQIWFGHRVPVWYKGEELAVGEAPAGEGWKQDEDTLDTWFSSGMWTFSALGWPDKLDDLKIYHPTDVLETGYEIIFFWVARMILMSGYVLGEVPFKKVYFHGTVRDDKGRKMSKSLGNGIDPMDVAKEFGTDAGRMALIIGTSAGTDQKISKDKIKGYKHFANKLWNISRFVMMNCEGLDMSANVSEKDAGLIKSFESLKAEVATHIESFEFHLAGEKAYHYVWHTFADVIIEESKTALLGSDEVAKRSAQRMLMEILTGSMKMLHPFMPFVTEEIWGKLGNKNLLMVEKW